MLDVGIWSFVIPCDGSPNAQAADPAVGENIQANMRAFVSRFQFLLKKMPRIGLEFRVRKNLVPVH